MYENNLGVKLILSQRLHLLTAAVVTACGTLFAINTTTKTVDAIDTTTQTQHLVADKNNQQAADNATAQTIVKTNQMIHPKTNIKFVVGVNPIAEAEERAEAAKAAAEKAAAEKAAAQKAAAQQAAAQQAAQKAAQQKAAQQQAAQQQASQPAAQPATASQTTTNKGTFKLSFYDPAVLGSNMGYGGVAANLSVFPKGTQLKITLSDGTVWYRVVNDTGGFAAGNPNQLDVAMPNNQIPAAGILYATVEVVG
ncbi:hydrolase [Lacticaseibacillus baoqingensis]|uniref:Hydrolase n=1 Tax=Lacticaseibacillus baoqingensis TaxID=2486013 RepID=A0ABW4E910_9LACO